MAAEKPRATSPGPAAAAPAASATSSPVPGAAVPAAPTSSASDNAAALVSLAQLRDQGLVTPDEFETKKAEILARM